MQVVHGRMMIGAVGRVVRWRGVHRTWRSPARRTVGHGTVCVLRSWRVRSADVCRLMRRVGEGWTGHRTSCDGGDGILFVDSRLGVHALLGTNVTQLRIGGRLLQVLRNGCGAGKVADEMQVLASGGGDAERLLDQAIRLVAVTIRTIIRSIVFFGSRRLGSSAEGASAALAFHLAVCEETARYTTRAP